MLLSLYFNNSVVFSVCLLSTLFIWTKQILSALQFPVILQVRINVVLLCFLIGFLQSIFYFVLRKDFPDGGRSLV